MKTKEQANEDRLMLWVQYHACSLILREVEKNKEVKKEKFKKHLISEFQKDQEFRELPLEKMEEVLKRVFDNLQSGEKKHLEVKDTVLTMSKEYGILLSAEQFENQAKHVESAYLASKKGGLRG